MAYYCCCTRHPNSSILLSLLCLLLLLPPLNQSTAAGHATSGPIFAFPVAAAASASTAEAPHELLHIALNTTALHVGQALSSLTSLSSSHASSSSPLAAAARDDCAELLADSLELLASAMLSGATRDDVLTWLSAALTNHDTCAEGLEEAGGDAQAAPHVAAARGVVRDCLAMYAAAVNATTAANGELTGIPVQNKKRPKRSPVPGGGLPRWLPKRERRLLLGPAEPLVRNADMVVAKDGSGTHRKIEDAVKAAPERSERRIVIYVKAGRYDENVKVGRQKTNLVFVGDGKGATVVAGRRSVADNYTTFHTATFAASGSGFIMRDMTVENWAGPEKHQAVALRVSADRAVVYRCNVIGYQDTLYAHSQRQFYRDCDVYGTVDFVFGNAAAVLQNCTLWARRPLPGQKNTVTAQNRKDPNQNTGLSVHACRVVPAPDLAPDYPTYLGRPWKPYSRVVYMMSYIGPHVPPCGWLEWNDTFALDTLYYGEYMNYGPGAAVDGRVSWPGYRVIADAAEAANFTVAQFIVGYSWLPSTGVSFLAGLSV